MGSVGAICVWSIPDAIGTGRSPREKASGKMGRKRVCSSLRNPIPWAGPSGEKGLPERRHKAQGGHPERVKGRDTGAGGRGRGAGSRVDWEGLAMERPCDAGHTNLEVQEGASTCHISITAAHRHGDASVAYQSMCTGAVWKLLCYP